MSDIKNKIREAVMSFSKGDHEEARAALKEVLAEKGKLAVNEMLNKEDDVEEGMHMSAGKKHMRAAHRHMSAGKKDMKKKRDMNRPERTDEMNDTGSDSGVVKSKYDDDREDVTAKKGSVKQTKNIDHKDYTGKKPNVYDKKDATDPKPVND